MIIKNTTDRTTPKVIGIGPIMLNPGEEKVVPDNIAMCKEFDSFGKPTGDYVLLPAIRIQQKLGMITVMEEPKKKEAPAPKAEPVEEAVKDEKSEETDAEDTAESEQPAEKDEAEATEEPKKTTRRKRTAT